jgi:cytidine deaminase
VLNEFLALVDGTRFSDLIEFGRAVHAEMEAVLSAARRGVPVQDTTIVCTTFPCHNCTRHLIAAGVRRVVFLIPYAKSLARELHYDAIVVDPDVPNARSTGKLVLEQFIGVTPRGFPHYFDFSRIDRKDNVTGRAKRLTDRATIEPRVVRDYDTWSAGGPALDPEYIAQVEQGAVRDFLARLAECRLNPPN